MSHKKIFATIAAIACTVVLVVGCSITLHENVMKSEPATIEQTKNAAQNDDKNVVKDAQKDDSDKASDAQSDSAASANKSDKNANKESGASADQSSSNANKSNSSASKPSSGNSNSHSSSTGNASASGGNNGSDSSASNPVIPPSSSSGNNTPTGCSHNYQPQYKDTYHEAVYEDQPVYEDRPVYEEHPVYDTIEYYACNKCGAQFDNSTDAAYHGLTVDGGSYSLKSEQIQTGTKQVQVGTERVQTGTQHVKVKDAYTSHDLVGYFCTKCGESK